jgi:serine acetyltransferase
MLRADYARTAHPSTASGSCCSSFVSGNSSTRAAGAGVLFLVWKIADIVFLRVLFGAELSPGVRAGAGLALPHAGRGVLLAEEVVIGENSMIFHGVTIAPERPGWGAPRLADNVLIAPGACVLGPIEIGSGAHIGPNVVVVRDVAAGAIVFNPGGRVISGD